VEVATDRICVRSSSTKKRCEHPLHSVPSLPKAKKDITSKSWLGKAHFLLEGVIHTYDEDEPQYKEWTKVKHVPRSHIVAVFDGSWRNRVRWRPMAPPSASPSSSHSDINVSLDPEGAYCTLIDLSELRPIPKSVRPTSAQLPHESRRLWESVTGSLLKREFSDATKNKVAIEQRQRDEAAERKRKGLEYIPRYFDPDIESGIPTLTAEGQKTVQEEMEDTTPPCIESLEGLRLSP